MTATTRFTATEDGGREIRLERPITGHEGEITHVRLRAPKYKDFTDLGDPTTLIVTQHALVPQDDLATIKNYITRLSGINEVLLQQTTLRDAMAMRDAVKDFFEAGSAATSTTSPTI